MDTHFGHQLQLHIMQHSDGHLYSVEIHTYRDTQDLLQLPLQVMDCLLMSSDNILAFLIMCL